MGYIPPENLFTLLHNIYVLMEVRRRIDATHFVMLATEYQSNASCGGLLLGKLLNTIVTISPTNAGIAHPPWLIANAQNTGIIMIDEEYSFMPVVAALTVGTRNAVIDHVHFTSQRCKAIPAALRGERTIANFTPCLVDRCPLTSGKAPPVKRSPGCDAQIGNWHFLLRTFAARTMRP